MILGIISDTHGSLHPRAVEVFREARVERILHAGDVGGFGVIGTLGALAEVTAVRGNVDTAGQAAQLPEQVRLRIEGVDIYMTHIGAKPATWLPRLPQPRPQVAICGHSHVALLEEFEGVLFLNPGAAGTQSRFGKAQTLALLTVEAGQARAEIITL